MFLSSSCPTRSPLRNLPWHLQRLRECHSAACERNGGGGGCCCCTVAGPLTRAAFASPTIIALLAPASNRPGAKIDGEEQQQTWRKNARLRSRSSYLLPQMYHEQYCCRYICQVTPFINIALRLPHSCSKKIRYHQSMHALLALSTYSSFGFASADRSIHHSDLVEGRTTRKQKLRFRSCSFLGSGLGSKSHFDWGSG